MTGMAAVATAASFPVVFFDGEREIDIGNVVVDPSFEFKEFQSILSQKIGIAPHQISVSLICRKKSRSSSGTRKIPINEKVNFGSILKEKDCFFVAVLKRSRRERRGKPRQNVEQDEFFSSSVTENFQRNFASPPEKVLLRREPGARPSEFDFISPFYGQITSPDSLYAGQRQELGFFDYENQLRNLQIQRDTYLMATNSYPYKDIKNGYSNSRIRDRVSKGSVICKECASAKEKPVPFHSCVYDTVTEGFRSPAGPIARPSKGSV